MKAALLDRPGELRVAEVPDPVPGPGEVLVAVSTCGVCRTDLHVVDGELEEPKLPLIPGHQVVGCVTGLGPGATRFELGARVGIPWLGWACGECRYCISERENLCPDAIFTGYTRDGGFAELVTADERFCLALPETPSELDVESARRLDLETAPLLCAGLIGLRALRFTEGAGSVGLYGFGAAAHLVCQIAVAEGRDVAAFTREGDTEGQAYARSLGAGWAGPSGAAPPEPLKAAIIFAPVGALVPIALKAVEPGGIVVCAGIHMSEIPAFPYEVLWGERTLRSVANLTRADGELMMELAGRLDLRASATAYPLDRVEEALSDLRDGRVVGAAVLEIS